MEVFVWYLANDDGTDYVPLAFAHLPDFLVGDEEFVAPLYLALLPETRAVAPVQVFDKTVYRDPKLDDQSQWDGTSLEEIKRVNPELIQLLAKVTPENAHGLAEKWFAAPAVRDFLLRWEKKSPAEEAKALQYLDEILRSLIQLAKHSLRAKKDVMERFWWMTA